MRTRPAPSPQKLNDDFAVFIGVDQTGAVLDGGRRAKPLPVAIAYSLGSKIELHACNLQTGRPLTLASFSRPEIERVLSSVGLPNADKLVRSSCTAILVDCVFGLPAQAWPAGSAAGSEGLRSLFARAAQDEVGREGYGLKAAATFFAALLPPSSSSTQGFYPVRQCEILAKANSVFRTHPYQKNIQCGTYRIWRDLGLAPGPRQGAQQEPQPEPWYHIRYFERASQATLQRPWLFEAYPSLAWRQCLGLPTRDLTRLEGKLREAFPRLELRDSDRRLLKANADHADAAILALYGIWLRERGRLFADAPSFDPASPREGWIVGLERAATDPLT